MESTNIKGKTITFYSYKGGVGRSMAVVNIGCLMAKSGYKVLMMDWDLEAPGLDTFFSDSLDIKKDGLLDFITLASATSSFKKDADIEDYNKFFETNLSQFIQKGVNPNKNNIKLDLMSSGKTDKNYSKRLNKINWLAFYKKQPAFFRALAQFLEQQYDYILIDARTGLADTSGICTMLMPQTLVTVFSLNKQNIEGVIKVAKQSLEYRFSSNDERDLTVLPLPSRIDSDNPVELQKWYDIYKNEFEKLFKDAYLLNECSLANYFDTISIPYKSDYAYGENIPVLTENIHFDKLISYSYNQFYSIIKNDTPIWTIKKINIQQANELLNLGNTLYELAKLQNNEKLYKESIEKYKQAIALNPTDADAYNNWGNALSGLAKLQNNEDLYKESFEKYKQAML